MHPVKNPVLPICLARGEAWGEADWVPGDVSTVGISGEDHRIVCDRDEFEPQLREARLQF